MRPGLPRGAAQALPPHGANAGQCEEDRGEGEADSNGDRLGDLVPVRLEIGWHAITLCLSLPGESLPKP